VNSNLDGLNAEDKFQVWVTMLDLHTFTCVYTYENKAFSKMLDETAQHRHIGLYYI